MSRALAHRYARALADVVLAPKSSVPPELAVEQLVAFAETVAASDPLRSILLSPAVPPQRKRAVLASLGKKINAAGPITNFLFVLLDRRRITLLPEILQSFEAILDERLGFVRAEVTSARELAGASKERLRTALAAMTGKQVRCTFSTEADLIGGVQVRLGSKVYDGSVRGQMQAMRRRLAE